MMKVAINGYGRIGRLAHRIILDNYQDQIQISAINAGDSTDVKGNMYLLKYDSMYGPILNHKIGSEEPSSPELKDLRGYIVIDNAKIPVFSQKDPSLLPWKDLSIDVVIESTGSFRKSEDLQKHITAGAKGVVLSAPPKDPSPADAGSLQQGSLQQSSGQAGQTIPTYILSVNSQNYKGENIISNASCTTNCIAPVAKIMLDNFGVEKAMMTTIHGYTSDQRLQDGGHKDYRRQRAAAENIIPTSTGATKATAKTLPSLTGIFTGLAIRVPVAVGSLADFTFVLKRNTTKEEINEIFKKEAANPNYQGILEVTDEPLVSSDIIGNPYSSIVDLSLTQVVGGNLVKVIAWYDNEYGYANRLVEEVIMVGSRISNLPNS